MQIDNLSFAFLLVAIGIGFYVSVIHFFIAIKTRNRNLANMLFAFMCVLFCTYNINLVLLNEIDIGSIEKLVALNKWGLAVYYLTWGFLYIFIQVYTENKLNNTTKIIFVFYSLIAFSNFVLSNTWVYTDIYLADVGKPVITLSFWYNIEAPLTGLLFAIYCGFTIRKQYKINKKLKSKSILIASVIFLGTYFLDIFLVEYDLASIVSIHQFGFLFFIIIISIKLAYEFKFTEKELVKNKKTFKEFAHFIADLFFVLDKDLNYIFWNKACENLLGVQSESVIGNSWYSFDFNNNYEWIADRYKKAILTKQADRFTLTFETNTKPRYFIINIHPTDYGLVVYMQDITALKETEFKLKESVSKYRLLYDNTGTNNVFLGLNGEVIDSNKAFLNYQNSLFNYCKKYNLNIEDTTIYEIFKKTFKKCINNREIIEIQTNVEIDDKLCWFHSTYIPVITNNNVLGVQIISREITKLKETEEALNDALSKYEMFSNINKEGIVVHELGLVTEVNKAFCDIFGYNQSELIGKDPVGSLFTPASTKILRERHKIEYTKPYLVDGVKKDGTIIHLEVQGHNLLYKNKNVRLARVRDITELKLVQTRLEKKNNQLQESENKYKVLSNSSKEGIVIHNLGKIIDANIAFVKILGYDFTYIIGKNMLSKVFENRNLEIVKENLMKPEAPPYIVEAKRKDGVKIWIEIESKNFTYNNQKARLTIIRDITEQKRKTDIIKESRERFRKLTNLSLEGLLIHKAGITYDINPALENIIKDSKENLIGKNFFSFCANDESYKQATLAMKKDFTGSFEIDIKNKKNEIVNIEVVSNILSKNENLKVAVIRDVTEKKIMEKKIMNAIIEAEEREREHIARELHDGLGPVLSSLNMYFDWFTKTKDSKNKELIIKNGHANIKEAIAIVEEISNNITPRTLNTFGLIAALETFISRLNTGLDINIVLNANFKGRLDQNFETSVYRVITELLNNTLKHANASEININLIYNAVQQTFIVLYTDNGKGFLYDDQLNANFGAGLVNINQRIHAFNGSIVYETKPDNGVSVYIKFNNVILIQDKLSKKANKDDNKNS